MTNETRNYLWRMMLLVSGNLHGKEMLLTPIIRSDASPRILPLQLGGIFSHAPNTQTSQNVKRCGAIFEGQVYSEKQAQVPSFRWRWCSISIWRLCWCSSMGWMRNPTCFTFHITFWGDTHLPPLGSGGNKRWKCCHWTSRDCAIADSHQLLHSDLDASVYACWYNSILIHQLILFEMIYQTKWKMTHVAIKRLISGYTALFQERIKEVLIFIQVFLRHLGDFVGRQILQDIVRQNQSAKVMEEAGREDPP